METPTQPQQPKKSFNPLAEAVSEKTYTNSASGGISQTDLMQDIGEPSFQPPPLDVNDIPRKESNKKPEQKQAFNPDMQHLSDSERNSSAAQMANFMITMYEKAHGFANEMLKIPEKKINKMQMEGTIDLDIPVPYEMGKFVPLGEFITEYNGQVAGVLVVEEEFKKNVIPPLTRVLSKRGHGMTDEQYLIFMFGQDLVTKGFQFAQFKSQTKQILTFATEQTAIGRQRPMQPMMQPIQTVNQPAYQEQPQQQHMAPVVPLQERVMQNHHAAIRPAGEVAPTGAASGLPNFGDVGNLTTMDRIFEEELKEKEKKERVRKRLSTVPQPGKKRIARKRITGIPGAPKRKPGPKPGSKRNKSNAIPS